MDDALKHMEALDYDVCWTDWRGHLKQTIEGSREYYRDETVRNLIGKLDVFLTTRVCSLSTEEELIADLWDAADADERKILARLFLKISDKL